MAKNPLIKAALESIPSRLAQLTLLPRAADNVVHVEATVTFAPVKNQPVGDYLVSFGLKEAMLNLEHSGHDITVKYQAALSKDVFSEKWKSKRQTATKLGWGVRIGLLRKIIFADIQISDIRSLTEDDNTSIDKAYNIITPVPGGWRIGSELGDPRSPEGAHSGDMEDCLDGQYFTGVKSEEGIGQKMVNDKLALCVLTPKQGQNDTQIKATLLINNTSLSVMLKLKPVLDAAKIKPGDREFEKQRPEKGMAIREALIKICIAKAEEINTGNPSAIVYSEGAIPLVTVTKSAPTIRPNLLPLEK